MILQYEPATGADIPVIFQQAKELIDTYEDIASIDYEKVMAWVDNKITKYITSYCCVCCDGERAAFYRLCQDGELDDLYVLPHYRGKGIGSQILRKCIAESADDLYLYVFSRNIRAISFYERLGFSIRERVGDTRLIMARNG